MWQPVIAIMYDFDKTLCTKDMQEYGFIPSLGMSASEFWKEARELTDQQEMDNVLAYMFLMVKKAKEHEVQVKKKTFTDMGKEIEFYPGVKGWFKRINKYGESIGVRVRHYIVSSGIKEIIVGTPIAKYFEKIYACEFMYDYNESIVWPKCAVNYTTKTQFLFRINKGVLTMNTDSTEKLNRFTPEDERPIPFRNMIYIGDGLTDVPCMKLVKNNGGQSIAVYVHEKGRQAAKKLRDDGRVNFLAEADYSKGSDLETIVQLIIKKAKAVEDMKAHENK